MKINKLNFKNCSGNNTTIDLTRDGINPYSEFFISGDHGSGKTKLLKLIWDCWQANLFHGEKENFLLDKKDHCVIEGSFHDNYSFTIDLPSKTGSKLILSNRVKYEENIANTILYYPSNRDDCIDERFNCGHVTTNCAIPIADLDDSTISNCCFLIDDICRGLDQSDTTAYIREIIKRSKAHNNQVIMTIDTRDADLLNIQDRRFNLDKNSSATFINIMELSNKIKGNKSQK